MTPQYTTTEREPPMDGNGLLPLNDRAYRGRDSRREKVSLDHFDDDVIIIGFVNRLYSNRLVRRQETIVDL